MLLFCVAFFFFCSEMKDVLFKELDNSQYNAEELICGGCSDIVGVQICGRHGIDYLEFKCRFCCSVAVYFWLVIRSKKIFFNLKKKTKFQHC